RTNLDISNGLVIETGRGNDEVILDGALSTPISVDGGVGADRMTVNDQATFASQAPVYAFGGGGLERVFRNASDPGITLGYSGIETITLNANLSSYGSLVVVKTLEASQLTLNLGNFSNVVTLGDATHAINGAVTINGGTGTDRLTINDQALL